MASNSDELGKALKAVLDNIQKAVAARPKVIRFFETFWNDRSAVFQPSMFSTTKTNLIWMSETSSYHFDLVPLQCRTSLLLLFSDALGRFVHWASGHTDCKFLLVAHGARYRSAHHT